MPYQNIVFMQGDEAIPVLDMIENQSEQDALEHLLQWDYGDGLEEENQPWGESDKLFLHHDLVLSWNTGIPYVSLTRIIL